MSEFISKSRIDKNFENSDDYANLSNVIDSIEQLIYLVTYLIDLRYCH